MGDLTLCSTVAMGTVVSIQVRGRGTESHAARLHGAERALGWFAAVEAALSRFDAGSELRRLTSHAGAPVTVSPMVFAAVQFALALAEETDGAFDPTVGGRLAAAGFDTHHRTGQRTAPPLPDESLAATWRDVALDAAAHSITLHRPLVLDLGAVAKGLAVDLAARELQGFANYAIDAGGDQFFGGRGDGAAWRVGVRDPRGAPGDIVEVLEVSDVAVCTSGDYERTADHAGAAGAPGTVAASGGGPGPGGPLAHHILDPRTGRSARGTASVTVVAPTAMVADGLATAAFVLGARDGIALLENHGVEGMVITRELERVVTRGWPGTPLARSGTAR